MENAIGRIKRKLLLFLRVHGLENWPKYLKRIVNSINNLPQKAIGNLKPADITSNKQDLQIDEARQKLGVHQFFSKRTDVKADQKSLKVGSYCYLALPKTTYGSKGSDWQVSFFNVEEKSVYLKKYIFLVRTII